MSGILSAGGPLCCPHAPYRLRLPRYGTVMRTQSKPSRVSGVRNTETPSVSALLERGRPTVRIGPSLRRHLHSCVGAPRKGVDQRHRPARRDGRYVTPAGHGMPMTTLEESSLTSQPPISPHL